MLVQLPIGDWSGDGHGVCRWFAFEVEIEGVTDANKATQLIASAINKPSDHPHIPHPHDICCEYQETHIKFSTVSVALAFLDIISGIMPNNYKYSDIHIKNNEFWFEVEELAYYTMAYAKLSIPSLTFKRVSIPWIHSAHFIGYGLLGQ